MSFICILIWHEAYFASLSLFRDLNLQIFSFQNYYLLYAHFRLFSIIPQNLAYFMDFYPKVEKLLFSNYYYKNRESFSEKRSGLNPRVFTFLRGCNGFLGFFQLFGWKKQALNKLNNASNSRGPKCLFYSQKVIFLKLLEIYK